jgi:hypothetical protein
MNNEQMYKKMEFIVEQQAKFAANMEILREVQEADAKLLKEQDRKITNALIGLVDIMGSLTRAQTNAEVRINLLADDFSLLTQAQARTEASLNILINTVERHLGGNGGSHSHA